MNIAGLVRGIIVAYRDNENFATDRIIIKLEQEIVKLVKENSIKQKVIDDLMGNLSSQQGWKRETEV